MALGDDQRSLGPSRGAEKPSADEPSLAGTRTSLGLRRLGDAAAWGWLRDARGRVGLIIAGELTLLHRSGLVATKALYLAAAVLVAVAAIPAVREVFRDQRLIADRRLILAAAAIGAIAVISLPVALYHHNEPANWVRDVSVYGLLAVAPALAIDLRRSAGIRWVSWALIAAGAVAAASFAVYWMTLRGYASLPMNRGLLLPSWYLGAALFAYASARAIGTVGGERITWALVAFAVFFSTVGTGTRSSVILLAAPIVQLVLSRHGRALAVVVCTVALIAAAFAVAENRGVDLGDAGNRLAMSATFVRHPTSDLSWQQRVEETEDAVDSWRQSPLLGVGAGHIFEWTLSGLPQKGFLIDTPAGFLAKFGLVGVLVLLSFLATMALVVRQRLKAGELHSVLPLVGLGAVALCGFAFGMPLEDKGFPVAFLLTYALTLPGAANTALPGTELRRRAWALAAVLGVTCVIAAATGGRIDTGLVKPSILGPISPPVRVIASYEEALWAGDGVRACALLAPSMRAHYWSSLDRCRAVLSVLTPGGSGFANSRASAPAVVGTNPRTLKIVVTRRDGRASLYVVQKRSGRWIILDSRSVTQRSTKTG